VNTSQSAAVWLAPWFRLAAAPRRGPRVQRKPGNWAATRRHSSFALSSVTRTSYFSLLKVWTSGRRRRKHAKSCDGRSQQGTITASSGPIKSAPRKASGREFSQFKACCFAGTNRGDGRIAVPDFRIRSDDDNDTPHHAGSEPRLRPERDPRKLPLGARLGPRRLFDLRPECKRRSWGAANGFLAVCIWRACLRTIHGEPVGHQGRDRRISSKVCDRTASRKGQSSRSPVRDKASATSLVAGLGSSGAAWSHPTRNPANRALSPGRCGNDKFLLPGGPLANGGWSCFQRIPGGRTDDPIDGQPLAPLKLAYARIRPRTKDPVNPQRCRTGNSLVEQVLTIRDG
jgi:hypothetical protein